MDINKWINVVKNIPKDKIKSDEGLKQVFRDIGKRMGKSFSEAELNQFVAQFRRFSRTETPGSLMNKLNRKGVSKDALNAIKRRFSR